MNCKQRLHKANHLDQPVGERYSIHLNANRFEAGSLPVKN
jgi:hypothetical protein